MKTITITVDVDGNEVFRKYKEGAFVREAGFWDVEVESMLDTIEKSNEKEF